MRSIAYIFGNQLVLDAQVLCYVMVGMFAQRGLGRH